jgi:predicted homoserine dehydrogenase-like protein
MTAEEARAEGAIPCGLLEGGRVTAPIAKGALITRANAALPPDSRIAALRARQDAMLGWT